MRRWRRLRECILMHVSVGRRALLRTGDEIEAALADL